MELPKTVTTTVYISKDPNCDMLHTSTCNMEHMGLITISKNEVTLELPNDFNEELAIETMKKSKAQAIKDKFDKEMAAL